MSIPDITYSIKMTNEAIAASQKNILNINVPGAHRVDSLFSHNGVELIRAEDPQITKALNSSITKAANTSVINNSLAELRTNMSDPSDPRRSKIVSYIEEFIDKAPRVVSSRSSLDTKQIFIKQGQNLAETISDATNEILDRRLQADKQISDSLDTINNIVTELFSINASISHSRDPKESNALFDDRDSLISRLAEFFDIKVSHSNNGSALIATANNSLQIVSNDAYAKFSYNSNVSKVSLAQGDAQFNPITMDHIHASGRSLGIYEVVNGADSNIRKIDSGKITGYLKLRDEILVNIGQKINGLSTEVINNVNYIHNKYSPVPPKSLIESTKKLRLSDSIDWEGKLVITATDKKGHSLVGSNNSGAVRPVTIDLSKISTVSASGKPTVSDMIDEINSYLNQGVFSPRLVLGTITEVAQSLPAPAAPNLLSNIQMVGTSDIDAAGNFSFDLELDGNQYFGSKVQITSVTAPNGVAITNLPDIFRLEKGEHTRTNQMIRVGGVAAGARDINVRLRVIGDNGVIEEGTATFTLSAANQVLNKRVAGVPSAAGADNMRAAPAIYAPIARARLVDDSDAEIYTDSGALGKLVIETLDDNNGLIITSDRDDSSNSFNNFFGLNNFFSAGNIPGTFNVNKAILDNPLLMSAGAIKNGNNIVHVQQGSGQAASLEILVPDIANGSTFTLGSNNVRTIFSFGINAGEITPEIHLHDNLKKLADAINNDPITSSLIKVRVNAGGNGIIMSASNLGTSSNNIEFSSNQDTHKADGTLVAMGGFVNLEGGTNTDANSNPGIVQYAPRLGDNDVDFFLAIERLRDRVLNFDDHGSVPSTTNTISGYAASIIDSISIRMNQAQRKDQVAQKTAENLGTKLKEAVGINLYTQFLELSGLNQQLLIIARIAGILEKTREEIFQLITR